jgi:hypothetical protein
LLLFFLVLVESLSVAFLLPLDSLLAESLSAESLSLESVSSESLSDELVLFLVAEVEPERPEREPLADELLSLLLWLSLSLAESYASSSALLECDDELVPCP